MSPEFLLTAFIVCVSPGIGVIYTLSMTLGGGLRAGLLAALHRRVVQSGAVHPAVVGRRLRVVEVGHVVAQRHLVAHVEQRDAAEGEHHRVEQRQPPGIRLRDARLGGKWRTGLHGHRIRERGQGPMSAA